MSETTGGTKTYVEQLREKKAAQKKQALGDAKPAPQGDLSLPPYLRCLDKRTNVKAHLNGFIPPMDPAYHFQPVTEEVCYDISKKRPLILIGHTGTGKTSMVTQVAAFLSQPVIRANMNGQTSISDFVGFWGVKGSETYWVDGVLPFAMREGFWLIVDELDFAEPPILSVLNAVLERNGKLVLKEKGHEVVEPHPNFRIIATANAVGQMAECRGLYQGTNIMNEAFLDRFQCYLIDYMQPDLEKKVVQSTYPDLPGRLVHDMVGIVNQARVAFNQENLQCTFSTRRLLDWAEKTNHLISLGDPNAAIRAAHSTIFAKVSREDAGILEGYMRRALGSPFDAEVKFEDPSAGKFKMSFKH